VDLRVLLLGETTGGLPECPDATVVVGDLGDNVLRVLREILEDDCLGLFAGVWGEICP